MTSWGDSAHGVPLRRALFVGLAVASLCAGHPADATTPVETLVVPNVFEATDPGGFGGSNRYPFLIRGGMRYQQVYDTSQFAAFGGPRLIKQIAFRPDLRAGGAFSVAISDLELRLSTIAPGPNALDAIFDANPGLDETLVFDGPITLFSDDLPGPGDTRAFDVVIDLVVPFLYDPAQGHLLLDVRNGEPGNNELGLFFDAVLGGPVSRVFGQEGSPGDAAGRLDAQGLITRFTHAPPLIEVDVDIKPGNDANPLNPYGRGVVPVAILGSDTFDVADVDVNTLAFGPDGARPAQRGRLLPTEANHDGLPDLVLRFAMEGAGLAVGDQEACVTGKTLDGIPFEGCDSIATVPACGIGFELVFVLLPLMQARRILRTHHSDRVNALRTGPSCPRPRARGCGSGRHTCRSSEA